MNLVEIGQIVNTHGVRGEIKINSWIDDLTEFEEFENYYYLKNGEYIKLTPEKVRFHKNCAIVKFKEINNMNEAETYKGIVLLSDKNENLPEDIYYVQDLIGLTVMGDGNEIGKVCDVLKTGANDVYCVKTAENKMVYIPAVKEFIKEIDIKNGNMEIKIIDGLLD